MIVLIAAAAIAQQPLQPWGALVGHCWVGPAPGGQGTDKHCFEAVYGGQHIRDRHVVTIDGRDVYAGETLYSARGSQVIFSYWNSLGGLGTGTAAIAGEDWRFTGTIHGTATSPERPMNANWKVHSDGFEMETAGGPPLVFKRAD